MATIDTMSTRKTGVLALYQRLIDPKLVRTCVLCMIFVYVPGILLALTLAFLYGGHRIEPLQFNLWYNYISDLGSYAYTPAPFVWDLTAIIVSLFMVPVFLYLNDVFTSKSDALGKVFKSYTHLRIVAFTGLFWMLVGVAGFSGIGIFSEDRDIGGLHFIFSAVVFGGFAMGALFSGIVVASKKTILPRISGFFMMFGSPAATILFAVGLFNDPPFVFLAFLEWMMLFAIMIWMVPTSIQIIRHANKRI